MTYQRTGDSSSSSQRVSSWDRSTGVTGRLPKSNGNLQNSTLTNESPASVSSILNKARIFGTPTESISSTQDIPTKRTVEQNRLMWALLTDISEQVVWYGHRLTKDEWKDVLTAGLRKTKIVPGIDGGFVMVGLHTSKMTIAEMTELIELCYAFGAQQGVKFSDEKGEIS